LPAGICDEHVNATALGVADPAGIGLGGRNGVGDATGLGEATATLDGDGPANATGVVTGVCFAVGVTLPHAVSTSRTSTSAAFVMLAITVVPVESYEPGILTRRGSSN
jgi:hypothetical protein